MKKLLLIIMALFLFLVISYSQSIEITSPDGKIWFKGKTYNITWNRTKIQSANVKINIFRNSIQVSNFVLQLTGLNSGLKKWTIPDNFSSGTYQLRIKDVNTNFHLDSKPFRISGKLSYHGKGLAYKPGKSTAKNTKTPVVTRKPPALPDMIISSIKNLRIERGKDTKHPKKYDYLRVQVKNNSNMDAQFFPGGEIMRASSGSNILDYYKGRNASSPKTGSKYITFRPGETKTVDFIISSSDPRERIPVTVKVDPNNVVRESNERNNTQNLIYLKKPKRKKKKPDLIIEKITSTGPFTRYGFVIWVRIKNIGEKGLSKPFNNVNILDITGTFNKKVKVKELRNLKPGHMREFKVLVLPGIWEGNCFLKIKVDPDNKINESSESNNSRTWATKIVKKK